MNKKTKKTGEGKDAHGENPQNCKEKEVETEKTTETNKTGRNKDNNNFETRIAQHKTQGEEFRVQMDGAKKDGGWVQLSKIGKLPRV